MTPQLIPVDRALDPVLLEDTIAALTDTRVCRPYADHQRRERIIKALECKLHAERDLAGIIKIEQLRYDGVQTFCKGRCAYQFTELDETSPSHLATFYVEDFDLTSIINKREEVQRRFS